MPEPEEPSQRSTPAALRGEVVVGPTRPLLPFDEGLPLAHLSALTMVLVVLILVAGDMVEGVVLLLLCVDNVARASPLTTLLTVIHASPELSI